MISMVIRIHRCLMLKNNIQNIPVVRNGEYERKNWLNRFHRPRPGSLRPSLYRVDDTQFNQLQLIRRKTMWERGLKRKGELLEFVKAPDDHRRKTDEPLVGLLLGAVYGYRDILVASNELSLPSSRLTRVIMQLSQNRMCGNSRWFREQ